MQKTCLGRYTGKIRIDEEHVHVDSLHTVQHRPMTVPGPRRRRQRTREYFALICALLLTIGIGRLVMPPSAHGPIIVEVVVYVLLYGTLYRVFWWLGGRLSPPS